ncbi:MAG: GNAT family N-acetyltransferase [Xanthomonadales bacterium]|nr:GNAT family N-acetyltransferase [Xanthomonadales bacterium]
MSTLRLQRLQPHQHDCAGFDCGEPRVDAFLQQRADRHSREGLSTTHVLTDSGLDDPGQIIGFYTLAPATVQPIDASPAAAVRLAKLAVAHQFQGRGHGRLLLAAAVARCLQMRALGIRALIADVLNAGAARFYREHGFRPIASNAMTLYLALPAIRADAGPATADPLQTHPNTRKSID